MCGSLEPCNVCKRCTLSRALTSRAARFAFCRVLSVTCLSQQLITFPGAVTMSAFGLGLEEFQSVDGEQGRRLSSTGARTNDLQVTVIEVASAQDGAWYWINIPSVHLALDITLLGVDNESPLPLSNEAIPQTLSLTVPEDPSTYEIRYIRHREFYNLPTDDCAPLQAARGVSAAVEHGVVSISQMPTANTKACGVDLAVWKPVGTLPHATGCAVAVSYGSTSMDGGYGSVQRSTACSRSSSHSKDGLPDDNATLYNVTLFVFLNDDGAFHNNDTAKAILSNAVAVKFEVILDNVVVATNTNSTGSGRRLSDDMITEIIIKVKGVKKGVAENVRQYVNEHGDQSDHLHSVAKYFALPFNFPALEIQMESDLPVPDSPVPDSPESNDDILVVVIISGCIGVFACMALVFVFGRCIIMTDDSHGSEKPDTKYVALSRSANLPVLSVNSKLLYRVRTVHSNPANLHIASLDHTLALVGCTMTEYNDHMHKQLPAGAGPLSWEICTLSMHS